MNSIRFIYCLSILGTFLFLGCSTAMFVSFGLCYRLNPNVYNLINVQGQNGMDITRWALLGFAIFCLIFALANMVMWCLLRPLMSNKKHKMIGELMYILGMRYVYKYKTVDSDESSEFSRVPSSASSKLSTPSPKLPIVKVSPKSVKSLESTESIDTKSIMGLGYDDKQLWTYRGQRPYPIKEPTDREYSILSIQNN